MVLLSKTMVWEFNGFACTCHSNHTQARYVLEIVKENNHKNNDIRCHVPPPCGLMKTVVLFSKTTADEKHEHSRQIGGDVIECCKNIKDFASIPGLKLFIKNEQKFSFSYC